jgi:mannose-6-phosphate isomerase-like protein (cupin superfamily)
VPVFTFTNPPAWCKLRKFEFLGVPAGGERLFDTTSPRELYICTDGEVSVEAGGGTTLLKAGAWREATAGGTVRLHSSNGAQVCRAQGHWKTIVGAGLFAVRSGPQRMKGSPYTYQKSTPFDRHFHDCDEYWIVLSGKARVSSEDREYDVGAGDCVATGMGWHHDVLSCDPAGIRAIYFETELEGRMRGGHLWEPEHAPAQPCLERV